MTVLVKSLQVNCRYAERDIRVCPKTDVIPMLTVAHASRLFTRAEQYDHARSSNHDRDNQYPRCGSMQIDGRCARCTRHIGLKGNTPRAESTLEKIATRRGHTKRNSWSLITHSASRVDLDQIGAWSPLEVASIARPSSLQIVQTTFQKCLHLSMMLVRTDRNTSLTSCAGMEMQI